MEMVLFYINVILFLTFCICCNYAENFNDGVSVVRFSVNIDTEDKKINQDVDGRRRKQKLRIAKEIPVRLRDKISVKQDNGSDTLNYPYIAAVIINSKLWCAGTIVDENWVVTAAHCLNYVLNVSPMKTLRKYVKVRVGSARAYRGGQLVDVVGAVRHPKFEEEPVPHADVALLKLAVNLVFNQYVNVIKIYTGMKEPYAQSFITVTGWGATSGAETSFTDPTPDLQNTRIKVRTRHYCTDAFQLVNGLQFTEDFFCASLRNGTRDVCLFDAGAPAVQKNQLMGIMSFGPERCGHEFQPAVFIKAFYFREFVKHTIAAYKTPSDIIQALEEIEPRLTSTVHVVQNDPEDIHKAILEEAKAKEEEVTRPDKRHD